MPAILSPEQIHAILEIIQKRHAAVILRILGPEALTLEERNSLLHAGIPLEGQANVIRQAYLYGQLQAKLEKPELKNLSLKAFEKHVAKHPVELSVPEEHAVKAAELHAGTNIRHLGAKIQQQVSGLVFREDAIARGEILAQVKVEVASNIQKQESIGKLKKELSWLQPDWNRDWNRVAITEKTNAMNQGVADTMQALHGPEAWVFKRPMPDACKHCVTLHIGPDGHPRIFKLSTLVANGSNVGKKTADWSAVVGTTHPHCQCQLLRVPPGWGFDESDDLVPGGTGGIREGEPLKKADDYVATGSHMGIRSVVNGVGAVNLIVQSPLNHAGAQTRAKTAKDVKAYLDSYLDLNRERYMIQIPNGAEIYNWHEGEPPEKVFPLVNVTMRAEMDEQARAEIPNNRLFLDNEIAKRLTNVAPNYVIKDPSLLANTKLKKAAPPKYTEQAGHQYIHKEWSKDHWLYTYAAEHSGKITEHHIQPDMVMLKLPKDRLAQLQAFRKEHGLTFEPVLGSNYALLAMTKTEAAGLKQKAKQLVIPADKPQKVDQTPKLTPVKASSLIPVPAPPPHILQSGQKVTVKIGDSIIKAIVVGQDGSDHAVLLDTSGKRRLAPWKHVKIDGEKQPQVSSYDALPETSIRKATDEHVKFIDGALSETMIPNGKPTRAYLDWLHAKGVEAYVVGGFTRDLLAGTAAGEGPEKIKAKLKDHDIVASAGVPTGKAMFAALGHGELYSWHDAGTVLAYGPGHTDGVDYASMCQSGFFDWTPVKHPDVEVSTPPITWDQDLVADAKRRDFSVNSVYYDVRNKVFLDPTGQGVEDSHNKFLRVIAGKKELEKNHNIAIRFWKFRVRGFVSDEANKAIMRKSFEKHAKTFDDKQMAKEILRAAGKGKSATEVKAFLGKLRAAMEEDGAGHLYQKFIQPREATIMAKVGH